NKGARAAAAGGLTTEVDVIVEEILNERFEIERGPIEPGEKVDERRRVEASLEVVRIDVLAGANEGDLGPQRRWRRASIGDASLHMCLDVRPGRPSVARSRRTFELRRDRQPRSAFSRWEVL